jgi:Bacteriophage probable baseplate hub protein
MANDRSTLASGLPSTDYYAPRFRIDIDNKEVDPKTLADVLECKVVLDPEHLSSCDLTINNWDTTNFTFKYTEKNSRTRKYDFEVGSRVHVQMGYADQLRSMMRGLISTLSPRFPESGPPSIDVNVKDLMFKLRDNKPDDKTGVKQWVNRADWEIVEQIAERHGLAIGELTKDEEKHKIVVQKNQDDASFLLERAKRLDYDCYITTDPDSGEDALNFRKPTDARDGRPIKVYRFEWGKSLINFNPVLTLSRQVSNVVVRGWDPTNKAVISYKSTPDDLPGSSGGGESGPSAARDKLGDKQEVVVDSPVTSEQEARVLAIALLRESAYEFITGTGKVIGLPDLRPGDNVDLCRLGERFNGTYYVKKVTHTIGASGYHTEFEVRKVFGEGHCP